ncbi:MAG: TatD family hydrolase [Candidatus Absconditabacterales bacterium]
MRLYDAHTHLNEEKIFPEWRQYLDLFIQAGGRGLVNSGASEQYNLRGIEIAKMAEHDFPDYSVKTTIGYHPGECGMEEPSVVRTEIITEENIQQKISDLRKLYEANKQYIMAIGECGIDTYFPGTENHLPVQKKLFSLQCDLAQELGLPLVVHVRKDFESALEILKQYHDITIHFHCRSFGPEDIERLLAEGLRLGWRLFIGFCGNVTYRNAQNLRDSLVKVPLEQLVLETDAPWLSPQAVRGTMNHPANVKYIYEFVAEFLKISPETLSDQVEVNFHSIYKV